MQTLRDLASRMADGGQLPEIFEYAFLTNALVAALIVGPLLGGLGTLVVVKRQAFFSEAVGHGALTGVAIGILLGEPATAPYASLFSFCLVFALLLHWIKSRTRVPYDALVGVFLAFAIALGAALLLYVAKQVNVHILENVLFGSILTVQDSDIILLGVIALITLLLAMVFGNNALIASLSPELAQVQGINTRLYDYAFVLLIALVTVASVKIIGAVLVGALLLIPATIARILSGSFRRFFYTAIAISTLSCVLGILLPMTQALPIPSGAAIVLIACGFFLTALLSRSLRSLL
uniref:metal ABC transporter permease n=1 Tax=Marinobacterium jannaschii TaxID=64970 RepID=UPI00048063B8